MTANDVYVDVPGGGVRVQRSGCHTGLNVLPQSRCVSSSRYIYVNTAISVQ